LESIDQSHIIFT